MSQNQLQVGPQTATDGSIITARGSRDAAQVVTEMHGKYFEAALRGQVFTASTVIAGVVIPVAAATMSSKFGMYNPSGSTKVVELISFSIGIDSATTVVNGYGFAVQRQCASTGGAPTSVTAVASLPLGLSTGASPVAVVHSQATTTNAAIPGVTAATAIPIPFYPVLSQAAATAVTMGDYTHLFDGKLLLAPDTAVFLCTTASTSTASFCQICWAEFPYTS